MVVESHPERLAAIGVQSAKIFSTPEYRPRARKTAIQLQNLALTFAKIKFNTKAMVNRALNQARRVSEDLHNVNQVSATRSP